ncbi:MAG: peptide chain release factor 2 [bacterium]|nr:peptide chain release factor 2 [bacterium]
MIRELEDKINKGKMKIVSLRRYLDLDKSEKRLDELKKEMEKSSFWDQKDVALKKVEELKNTKNIVEIFQKLTKELEDLSELAVLSGDEEDSGKELMFELDKLIGELDELELKAVLNNPQDINNAFLVIHPGAGGTESQDWAQILLRMYMRFAEIKNYRTEIVDYLAGEEAGIKSVTVFVEGQYAFGYLNAETGVHRLVRISPFDSNKRRHTSFASVFVYPEVEDDVEIVINEKDLRIDTFRAGGAGGQHVNKTDSAIRITHIPTGIVVQCQNERSQFKNKAMAMKMLRSKLYDLQQNEKKAEEAKLSGDKKEIGWGSQIRSYIFQPYQLVKDHRTGLESGNVQAVIDGKIYPFIEAYLKKEKKL